MSFRLEMITTMKVKGPKRKLLKKCWAWNIILLCSHLSKSISCKVILKMLLILHCVVQNYNNNSFISWAGYNLDDVKDITYHFWLTYRLTYPSVSFREAVIMLDHKFDMMHKINIQSMFSPNTYWKMMVIHPFCNFLFVHSQSILSNDLWDGFCA